MRAIGVVIGLLLGLGAAWMLLSGHRVGRPYAGLPAAPRSGDAREGPLPPEGLRPPATPEEAARAELERRRVPYYRALRTQFAGYIESFVPGDAPDTLVLVLSRADDATIKAVVQQAVAPTADRYAFRHARLYVRNPRGSVQPLTLIAESSYDGSGHWDTFAK